MEVLVSQIFTGLSIASILLLIALGLAIIYGTMGVINLAHGELVMLGAYSSWFLQSTFGLSLVPSLFVVFLMVGFAGWLIERGIVRFLYNRPMDTILATWGIGIMLQQGIRIVAGAELRYVELAEIFGPQHRCSRHYFVRVPVVLPSHHCTASGLDVVFTVPHGIRCKAARRDPEQGNGRMLRH